MKERRNQDQAKIPTNEEIDQYLKWIESENSRMRDEGDLFSIRVDQIESGTTDVRLVTEDGVFLGFGEVGRYDWFTLNMDSKRKPKYDDNLHHENSSKKFNMTMLSKPFYIKTKEIDGLIDKIKP